MYILLQFIYRSKTKLLSGWWWWRLIPDSFWWSTIYSRRRKCVALNEGVDDDDHRLDHHHSFFPISQSVASVSYSIRWRTFVNAVVWIDNYVQHIDKTTSIDGQCSCNPVVWWMGLGSSDTKRIAPTTATAEWRESDMLNQRMFRGKFRSNTCRIILVTSLVRIDRRQN